MGLSFNKINGKKLFRESADDGQVEKAYGFRKIPENDNDTASPKSDEYIVDAAGNGDYTTISEALVALGSSSGTIRVLAGTYTITQNISLGANQSIIGSGYGTLITTTSDITSITLTGNRSSVFMCRIDGNNTGSNQIGISVDGDECNIKDCWITQMGGDGIYCDNPQKLSIQGCRIEDVSGNAIASDGSNGGSDNSVINDNFIDNAGADGIQMISMSDNVISGNQIINCDVHGMHVVSSTHNIFTGNHIFSNGDSTTGSGILITTGSHENVIVANHISQNNDWGVDINSGAQRTLVSGNVIYTNGDGEIQDAGTATLSSGNIIA